MSAGRQDNTPKPVTVIGGYLGAGKTTLVNHLLRHARGTRIAVLVNEFGALPIDGDLIEGAAGSVLTLAGGCICCSFGDDLQAAMLEIEARQDGIDHVVIEASGVALPASIASAITLHPAFEVGAIVTLVDAETVRERAVDRYMADTVARQIATADLVVINKSDLVSAANLAEVEAFLSRLAPTATRIVTTHSTLPPEVVLGIDQRSRGDFAQPLAAGDHGLTNWQSTSVEVPGAVDATRLGERLTTEIQGLIRAKGFVIDRDGIWKTLQIVGKRAVLTRAPLGMRAPGRIVCIASGLLPKRLVAEILAHCAVAG
jgi:G3E family GTPase